MYSKDIRVQISGNNKLIAKNSVFEFKDLYLVGKPDYKTTISFSSSAIDQMKHKIINGKPLEGNLVLLMNIDLTIPIYFRSCLPGEVI